MISSLHIVKRTPDFQSIESWVTLSICFFQRHNVGSHYLDHDKGDGLIELSVCECVYLGLILDYCLLTIISGISGSQWR